MESIRVFTSPFFLLYFLVFRFYLSKLEFLLYWSHVKSHAKSHSESHTKFKSHTKSHTNPLADEVVVDICTCDLQLFPHSVFRTLAKSIIQDQGVSWIFFIVASSQVTGAYRPTGRAAPAISVAPIFNFNSNFKTFSFSIKCQPGVRPP